MWKTSGVVTILLLVVLVGARVLLWHFEGD